MTTKRKSKKKKIKRCSWCGKDKANLIRYDAVGLKHYFHKVCALAKDNVLGGLS